MERDPGPGGARRALGRLLEAVLASRAEANAVFDILAVLQVGARGAGPGIGGREGGAHAGRQRRSGIRAFPGVCSRLEGLPGRGRGFRWDVDIEAVSGEEGDSCDHPVPAV